MLSQVVLYALLSSDGSCLDVFTVSGDDTSCFCDFYYIGFVFMAMVASTNHCTMGPQSTILPLNHYYGPY